ncbi:hypothetical protein [Paramicrobacterium humi]|uniref:hypothetical protein n=1 Tax=Paramicrobacterium humi TaxID=640635 RepID=UPI001FDFB003|nr:hypothetical protein [Microbacterium humi]
MPNTSEAAVAYRKNSYHSTTVPTIEAATTFLSPTGTSPWFELFGFRPVAVAPLGC